MDFQLATCRHLPGLTPGDDLLRLALEARGVPVAAAPWDAIDAGHGTGPFVCLRSTWDYHRRWPEFRRWVEGFAAQPGRLWNPASTVLWNADKVYLRELADAGVAIPPTWWFEPGDRADWPAVLRETGAAARSSSRGSPRPPTARTSSSRAAS